MSISLEQIMSDARMLQARLHERGKFGVALHLEVNQCTEKNCIFYAPPKHLSLSLLTCALIAGGCPQQETRINEDAAGRH